MEILFLVGLMAIILNLVWYSWKYGITPTPTSKQVRQVILQIFPSSVAGKVTELGSGWGHLAFTLAKHYPDNQIEAYEISPIPYSFSWLWAKWKGYSHLTIERKDFFHISLGNSALIICYLYPGAMQRLKVKFEKELRPGTVILTHTFAIPGWKPAHVYHAADLYRTPIFIYTISQL